MKNSLKMDKYTLKLKIPRHDKTTKRENNLLQGKQGTPSQSPQATSKSPHKTSYKSPPTQQKKSPPPQKQPFKLQPSQSTQKTNLLLGKQAPQVTLPPQHPNLPPPNTLEHPAPIRPTDQRTENLLCYPSNLGRFQDQPGVKLRYVDIHWQQGPPFLMWTPFGGPG